MKRYPAMTSDQLRRKIADRRRTDPPEMLTVNDLQPKKLGKTPRGFVYEVRLMKAKHYKIYCNDKPVEEKKLGRANHFMSEAFAERLVESLLKGEKL